MFFNQLILLLVVVFLCHGLIFATEFTANTNSIFRKSSEGSKQQEPIRRSFKRESVRSNNNFGVVAAHEDSFGPAYPNTNNNINNKNIKLQSFASCVLVFVTMTWRIYSKLAELSSASTLHPSILFVLHGVLLAVNALGLGLTIYDATAFKNLLKLFIVGNTAREAAEFISHAVRVVFSPPSRDHSLGSLLGNAYFVALYLAYIRSSWLNARRITKPSNQRDFSANFH